VQHIARGTSLKTIQEVMGHQDIRTTESYIPLAKEIAKKEMEENAL
jgi:site-specific recombinase XerD